MPRVLTPTVEKGYVRVNIGMPPGSRIKNRWVSVHQLVTEVFHKGGEELGIGMEPDHLNGCPWDNRPVNLWACTHAHNLLARRSYRKEEELGVKKLDDGSYRVVLKLDGAVFSDDRAANLEQANAISRQRAAERLVKIGRPEAPCVWEKGMLVGYRTTSSWVMRMDWETWRMRVEHEASGEVVWEGMWPMVGGCDGMPTGWQLRQLAEAQVMGPYLIREKLRAYVYGSSVPADESDGTEGASESSISGLVRHVIEGEGRGPVRLSIGEGGEVTLSQEAAGGGGAGGGVGDPADWGQGGVEERRGVYEDGATGQSDGSFGLPSYTGFGLGAEAERSESE
jgi:hypothetical protein